MGTPLAPLEDNLIIKVLTQEHGTESRTVPGWSGHFIISRSPASIPLLAALGNQRLSLLLLLTIE